MKEWVSSKGQDPRDALNARELETLDLLAKGLSNQEIALKLSLALETVKWYNKQLFSKLGVGSRSQAVATAVETGILAGPSEALRRKEARPAHNLPASITSFIGRESEIQEVARLVTRARLVTITGSGGVGKTRLAIQVAGRLVPHFPHGVWWVGLASLVNAAPSEKREPTSMEGRHTLTGGPTPGEYLVTQAAAKALRVAESPDQPLLVSVLEHLRDRQCLVVLDNCEHLIEACAALSEQLLGECPGLTILATSREALGVPGEKAWRLPSLSLPEDISLSPPTQSPGGERPTGSARIFQSEAVSLFIERAADVLPGYQPGETDAPVLAQICQRLDGIPLAIELAAARVNLLSLPEIAARLDRRFSLLTGGRRTALARHQTLRAAIEWSYDLLSDVEQATFRRLSVFTGSFTLEAAEAISTGPHLPAEEVLTLLGRLLDKSLLMVEPAPQDTGLATRYRFLDTIRDFGRLKLEEANEARAAKDRYAAYYVSVVEAAGPELLLENQARWYRVLQAENDNLRAVVEWSAESDQAEIGLRVVGALLWFWWSHGSSREGRDLALKILALPSANHRGIYRARALNTAGYLHWVLGETDAATQRIEEAISILRQTEDEASLAWSIQLLGLVLILKGEYDLADQAMKEGIAIAQKLGDYKSSIFSLAFQGDIALQQGDPGRARRLYEESAGLLRAFGNVIFLAYPLRRLGYLHLEQNETARAWDYFHQSLHLNQEVGDKRAVTACLTAMAALALRLSRPEIAARLYGAVENRLESLSIKLLPLDQSELARLPNQLLAILGQASFNAAYSEGWAMSEEEAILLSDEMNPERE